MKKASQWLLFLVLILFAPRLSAQSVHVAEAKPVNNIVKISPVQLFWSTLLLSYERMLAKGRYSVMFSAGVTYKPLPWIDGIESGFQQELQFRFYLVAPENISADRKNILFMKGLYLGPYTSYSFRRQSTGNNGNNEITFNTFSAGAVVGAQFALGNRLFLDIFTGGGYRHSVDQFDATTYFGTLPQERRGIAAKGGFQLGVGF